MNYVDGWYEIPHTPPEYTGDTEHGNTWAWAPRQRWCDETFEPNQWQMRNPIYNYSKGPNGPGKRILSTIPLTWRFKREKDAMLFILRWGR